MSILTRWLLIPPVNARLIGRYRDYRRHGASAFSATLGCFWMILAWIFIPLEHPRWQRIRAEHKNLYPHINASRPRPLDPVLGIDWPKDKLNIWILDDGGREEFRQFAQLSHSNMLVIDRCIAQRNAETAQAGIFRSAEYSWTLPSMDERAA